MLNKILATISACPKIEDLFKIVLEYGHYVRTNKLDGLQSWQPLKNTFLQDSEEFNMSEKLIGLIQCGEAFWTGEDLAEYTD